MAGPLRLRTDVDHLSVALAWLRARLEHVAAPAESQPATAGGLPWSRRPKGAEAADAATLDERDAAGRMLALESDADDLPPLAALADRLGLGRFERDVLLLCAAMELDTRAGGLCARAQDDPSRAYPTFALALSLFDDPDWGALAPDRPLRAWRLIEVHQPPATPLIAASLRADERVVHFLKGINRLDPRLQSLVTPVEHAPGELSGSQQDVAAGLVRAWRSASERGETLPVLQLLLGPGAASKRLVAATAAARVGRNLLRLPAEYLPSHPAEIEDLARLWQRESRLLPLALLIDADDAPTPPALARFLDRDDSPVLVATHEPLARLGRSVEAFEVRKPTVVEQRAAWSTSLGPGSDRAARRLAGQFRLDLPALGRIADEARAATDVEARAWDLCRDRTRPRVGPLARRIEPRAGWDDLVLPGRVADLLRQVASQVEHRAVVLDDWGYAQARGRGLGLSVLFAGESGTGKTLAAEVLARELRLDLFRIDLSTVVDKYIGETEKNLRRMFDGFDESSAILFFDEADALFGRRTEVKDSHDRYANIEVNYLLQRLEDYRGLAILATNMKSALDGAFLRRLRFVVDFPMPGRDERSRIWQVTFPLRDDPSGRPGVPTEGLDLARLASLDLAGGSIHSVALNASFRAAADAYAPGVTMSHVLAAARDEFAKLDRPMHDPDLRPARAGGRP